MRNVVMASKDRTGQVLGALRDPTEPGALGVCQGSEPESGEGECGQTAFQGQRPSREPEKRGGAGPGVAGRSPGRCDCTTSSVQTTRPSQHPSGRWTLLSSPNYRWEN